MESLLTVSLTTVFGACFVLLGRWLYLNPRRLPSWGFFNPEHSGTQKVARVYATFFIFFGMFASVGIILAFFFRRVPGMSLLSFAVAAGGAWFIRPKLPQPERPIDAPTDIPEQRSLLSKHWKRNLAIAGSLFCLLMLAIVVSIGDSDVCKIALQQHRLVRLSDSDLENPSNADFLFPAVFKSPVQRVTQTSLSPSTVH
jgi:hypothetical protein